MQTIKADDKKIIDSLLGRIQQLTYEGATKDAFLRDQQERIQELENELEEYRNKEIEEMDKGNKGAAKK